MATSDSSASAATPNPTPTQARPPPRFSTALAAGAFAGFAVDVSLFPLDTLKTRAQSSQGFWRAGGFKGVYNGLSSVAAGSAPGAATFFVTYESLKPIFSSPSAGLGLGLSPSLSHMLAASVGETAACLIRVPTEVIKSRMQAGVGAYKDVGLVGSVGRVLAREGVRGMWKGFGTTVAREIPFTCIQFPLYERLKLLLLQRRRPDVGASPSPSRNALPPHEAALVGSFSGGFAAALTTPLDVVKTRLMLAERAHARGEPLPSASASAAGAATVGAEGAAAPAAPPSGVNRRFLPTLRHVYRSEGVSGLFRGVVPRTIWISLGGAVFLGSFEAGVKVLEG